MGRETLVYHTKVWYMVHSAVNNTESLQERCTKLQIQISHEN